MCPSFYQFLLKVEKLHIFVDIYLFPHKRNRLFLDNFVYTQSLRNVSFYYVIKYEYEAIIC